MDRFTGMRLFARVVETGSFSGAARDLRLSKSAISKHVRALEDRLGVRLLNRTTRRLSPTEEGRTYYEWCVRIGADVAEAEAAVAHLHGEPRGTLRVNAPMSFGILRLGPALGEFLGLHPELSVDLTLNDRYVDVVEEGFDVAIRIGELTDSSLIARKLAASRRVVCAAPDYFARHGVPKTPANLRDHNCLTYSYLRAAAQEWRLVGPEGEVPVTVSGTLNANNGDVLRAALIAGVGIGWAPDFIVGEDIRAGRLVPALEDYVDELGVYALYPPGRHQSAKLRVFIDFLAGRFGTSPGSSHSE